MSDERSEQQPEYRVVLNDELQYSIWRADAEPPAGWRIEGTAGTREECLAHIDEVWTDMRPLSLREEMAAAAG
ncbi:MbtH family NRPS accessory protein [Streptomyces sp. NPDC046712]|uniref:MbtH family protein n=1 Tax=Streptomyces sp. NPDC046712 TaxID=3154802 RepID=UPI00340DABED